MLFLVTYSASAGKGTLQHAPYETVGPMLGKIAIEFATNGTIEDMGRFCHGMGIQAVIMSCKRLVLATTLMIDTTQRLQTTVGERQCVIMRRRFGTFSSPRNNL